MYNVRIVIRVLEPAAGHHLLCGRFQENLENQENPKKDAIAIGVKIVSKEQRNEKDEDLNLDSARKLTYNWTIFATKRLPPKQSPQQAHQEKAPQQ